MSRKGKEKMGKKVVKKEPELPLEDTRENIMFSKYLNFVDFIVMECFPNCPALHKIIASQGADLTPSLFFELVSQVLVPNWPGDGLSVGQVRTVIDTVLARLLVQKPEFFQDAESSMWMSAAHLADAQVDKLYRYAQCWVYHCTSQKI